MSGEGREVIFILFSPLFCEFHIVCNKLVLESHWGKKSFKKYEENKRSRSCGPGLGGVGSWETESVM